MSLNKVMLIGHVGKDAEVRYFRSSNPADTDAMVAHFTVATNERNRDGSETTEWHNITAWRASAQFAEKYIRKGVQVYIEGRLHTNVWTDQNGVSHSSAEIFTESIQLLGRKEDTAEAQADEPKPGFDEVQETLPSDGLPF
ncbi:MAG: single-stranded DNA-binding protein [Bacteroidales bacterium]|nr:single-stranded DNA-binding protein [Bacteroidales bacterium]